MTAVDDRRMYAAMRVLEIALVEHGNADPAERHSDRFKERLRHYEDAARVKVRRVVAALNGIDVNANTSPPVTAETLPTVVDRALADRIKAAMCNARVFAALTEEVGADAAAALLGDVSLL